MTQSANFHHQFLKEEFVIIDCRDKPRKDMTKDTIHDRKTVRQRKRYGQEKT